MRRCRSQHGFTFIEIIVALALFGVIYAAVTTLLSTSYTWVAAGDARTIAVVQAQGVVDVLYTKDITSQAGVSQEDIEDALSEARDDLDLEQVVEFSVDTYTALPGDYFEVTVTAVNRGKSASVTVLIPVR